MLEGVPGSPDTADCQVPSQQMTMRLGSGVGGSTEAMVGVGYCRSEKGTEMGSAEEAI
jgi:hypothetical protein